MITPTKLVKIIIEQFPNSRIILDSPMSEKNKIVYVANATTGIDDIILPKELTGQGMCLYKGPRPAQVKK
jgi:hypothetical protein